MPTLNSQYLTNLAANKSRAHVLGASIRGRKNICVLKDLDEQGPPPPIQKTNLSLQKIKQERNIMNTYMKQRKTMRILGVIIYVEIVFSVTRMLTEVSDHC